MPFFATGRIVEEQKKNNGEFLKGIIFGALIAGIIFMGVFLFRYGTFARGGREGSAVLTSDQTRTKLVQMQSIIKDAYLNEVDGEKLETGMFAGIMSGLGDPYAQYFSSEMLDEFMRINEGQYYGIGIVFTTEEDEEYPFILTVYPGSPAQTAGVQQDDIILKVGTTDTAGMDVDSVAALIDEFLDAPDDETPTVEMTVKRGEEELQFEIPFDMVETAPVTYEMLEDKIGYVQIPEFDTVTVEQFSKALESLNEQGMEKLILDVRNNPGGLLDTVNRMLDDLLPDCLIVTTRSKDGREQENRAKDGTLFEGPAVVLVNGQSASAAEVFAGTLQYYDAACVIGETTFGKGVVQRTYSFSDGSAVKLTTDKYYVAGEVDIDGVGVAPDITVLGQDEQMEEAVKYLTEDGKGN